MKERNSAEKNLKSAFDNYEMPFDNDAFDKFKDVLDEENKKKRFIWWFSYGKWLIPILLLAFITYATFHFFYNQKQDKLSSSSIENTKTSLSILSSDKKIEDSANTLNYENQYSTITTSPAESKTTKNEITSSEKIVPVPSNRNSIESRNKTSILNSSSDFSSLRTRNETTSENTTQLNYGNGSLINDKSINIISASEPSYPRPLSSSSDSITNEILRSVEKEAVNLILLNPFKIKPIKSQQKREKFIYTIKGKPRMEKFKKYIYFNVGTGMTFEDNFGTNDAFFDIQHTREYFWQSSVACQVSPTTAFELNYMQKNISIGFSMKDYSYSDRYAKKISMVKANMVNKIIPINTNLSLSMMNGISYIIAPSHINEFADSRNRFQAGELPNTISNIDSEWVGVYEGTHLLYSGGLRLDYMLSSRLEFSLAGEYTLGFNPIMKSSLSYIEGEGINKQVETQSNASFGSLSFSLKYILKR